MKIEWENSEGKEISKSIPSKIRLDFKTSGCIIEAVRKMNISEHEGNDTAVSCECMAVEDYEDKLERWLEFGELLTIEFDVDKMTATVVEVKDDSPKVNIV